MIYDAIAAHALIKWALHISYNAAEIVHHIVLRIQHLKKMLIECFQLESYEKIRTEFGKCVDYHIEILR